MPRGADGRVAETVKMPPAGKVAPETGDSRKSEASMHQEHRDRLDRIEKHLGLAHKADEMKSEDQGGRKGKEEAGHVTERVGASYGRKRH